MPSKPCALPEAPAGILKTPPLASDRSPSAGDAPWLAWPSRPDVGGVAPPILFGLVNCHRSEHAVQPEALQRAKQKVARECHDGPPRESSNSLSGGVAAQSQAINSSRHTGWSWSCLAPPNTILMGRLGANRLTLSEALPAMPFDETASLGQGTPDSHYASGVTPGMVINEVAQP